MSNLSELVRQRAELERQIASIKAAERRNAIERVRVLMAEYGISLQYLTLPTRSPQGLSARKPVAIKYRDNQGNKWSGRGLKPKWLVLALADGKLLTEFLVE